MACNVANSSEFAIDCQAVTKVWAHGSVRAHKAVCDINLSVKAGECVALIGPSGCGKSTLLYLISGLEEITNGAIYSFGERIRTPSPDRSLIFQETSLFPWLNVWKNVSFGLAIRGTPPDERKALAHEALKRVGLAEAMEKWPHELSGGMRQRIAVARALALRPKILLMDEPFAALDVQTRQKMYDFLQHVWRESAISVMYVTHSIDEVITLADRVIVLTAHPGHVKKSVSIDLPRPRDLFAPECIELRMYLSDLLRDEVDRAFREQETFAQ